MMVRPSVVDSQSGDLPRVHIRSTVWGSPWPPNAPALCGTLPQALWKFAGAQVTCTECLHADRTQLTPAAPTD
jgi:hypothetical protein